MGLNVRVRSIAQLGHKPSGRGKGKWHNRATLWCYVCHRRVRNHLARASRRRNRAR